jgi:uncharacterized protein (TIGR00255 family)
MVEIKIDIEPMSILSMTGYASAQTQILDPIGESLRLGLEIRSVNSRFLDLSFKISDDLRIYEPQLRELITHKLKRGKVELRLFLETAKDSNSLVPSQKSLHELYQVQEQIFELFPTAAPLSIAEILKLSSQPSQTSADLQSEIIRLTTQVLNELIESRAKEGQRLVEFLLERIHQLRGLISTASPLVPLLVQAQRQKFLDRWQEAMSLEKDSQVTPEQAQDRALSEATAFALKIDVAEELTRLNAHLDEIEVCLNSNHPQGIGKRLDFLIQELHRESNTLGSKSTALELSRISVDMKVLIEQMREQVQNLE